MINSNINDDSRNEIINDYRMPILNSIKESNNFDECLEKIFGCKVPEPFYSDLKSDYENSKKWYETARNVLNLGLNSKTDIDYTNDMQKAMDKGASYCDELIKKIIACQLIEENKVDFINHNDVYDYLVNQAIESNNLIR